MSTTSLPAAQHPPALLAGASLPADITQEGLKQAFEKWKRMRDQGVPAEDPEMRNLVNILQAAKREAAFSQAMHQQKMTNGNSGASLPNGSISHAQQTTNGHVGANAAVDSSQQYATAHTSTPQIDGAKTDASSAAWISPEQRKMLNAQMLAFKMLQKNAPVPADLQRIVFPSMRQSKSPTPLQALDAAEKVLDDIADANSERASAAGVLVAHQAEGPGAKYGLKPLSFQHPWDKLAKEISYKDYNSRKARIHYPGIFPSGVDPEVVRADREMIIYNRIMARRKELDDLNANISSWNTSKSDLPQLEGTLKLKALIEYKKLNLLGKQRALREQIAREVVMSDNLNMTINRAQYRRQKKQAMREAQFTDKMEKDQRHARETKEEAKHRDRLKRILDHADNVYKDAQEQRARVKRLGRLMLNQHQVIEKEEQKRVERTARQRLQALKANDEETYLKLLGQAKDSRISHLLKQTDGFLKQLAASVKHQQRSHQERYGKKSASVEPESDDEGEDEEREGRVDYYDVAHRIKEEINEQSPNLVGGLLKEYQVKGLEWMISLYNNNLNGILADEMGLGKTIQTISLITYLIEKKRQNGPFLVVVPLSTLTNWNNEFEKWAPTVQRIVYKGPPTQRKSAQFAIRSGQFQVLLTTYEFIIKDRPILSKVKWLHMVVDEGHRMKNSNSKLSSTITQYYSTRYRLILTGTPLQNNLPELWALLNFVLPTIFKSVKSFDEWFNTPFANTGGQDKMDLTEEEKILIIKRLHKVLRPFLLRRLKKDVEKDLPDKHERVVKCNLSPLQQILYRQLHTSNKMMISDGKGGRMNMRGLSNILMQLRKICNHPFVFEEIEDQVNPQRLSNDLLWRTSGKFELLDRVLPKFLVTGHRVLMFFQMTQIMNIMEDFMRLRGYKYLRLDGSTKADERADLLKTFNEEGSEYFCFLLSTRAGGLGLNLQTADTVVIFDSDWNPHQDLQAQDRAHRIGQKNEVRILRLISSHSIEEKILERAQYKLDMDGKVIQAGKFDHKSSDNERDAMLRVMLETAEATEDLGVEEMDDEDLNMIMMRSDEELEIFQRMDAERARDPIYGVGKKLPRLIGENELPAIYVKDEDTTVEEEEVYYGRGARERTRVRYDDGLTEEQWLMAVDDEQDTIEAAMARKDARKERRATNRDKRARLDNGVSPLPSRETSESPAPSNKKRGRKAKRKADELSVDEESSVAAPPSAPPRKRGRASKIPDTLTASQRDCLQDVLNQVWDILNDLEADSTDPEVEKRAVIDPFVKLPERRAYPDYYQIIQDPISMEQMEKKINNYVYQSLNGLAEDIRLMCHNCRTFNEDASILYGDATLIETTAMDTIRKLSAENAADLGTAAFHEGDSGSTDGHFNSTSASGIGTPAPPAPRLKLHLGSRGADID